MKFTYGVRNLKNNHTQQAYIYNNGNSAGETRTQDTASKSGLSNYINSSEGVFYAEISGLGDSSNFRVLSISDGTGNNRYGIGFANSNDIYSFSTPTTISAFFTPTNIRDFFKVALSYKSGEQKLFVNGSQIGSTTTSTNLPTNLNRIGFDSGSGGSAFQGKVKDLRVYNEALTDQELTELTS